MNITHRIFKPIPHDVRRKGGIRPPGVLPPLEVSGEGGGLGVGLKFGGKTWGKITQ